MLFLNVDLWHIIWFVRRFEHSEVISSVHINDLDLSECSSDTPVAVLVGTLCVICLDTQICQPGASFWDKFLVVYGFFPTVFLLQHLLRLLLEPNVSLRATPRSLLERHPVFTMPPSSILGETLEDLVYTMKQKTAER